MSWKATAYVKELVEGLSHTEKLVLFVLADYHNSAKKVAWPSMPVLAAEALMSERNLRRILANLEAKKVILRVQGRGGKDTTLYCFPVLDQEGGQIVLSREDKNSVWEDSREDKNTTLGGQIEHANKEERLNRLNKTVEPNRNCNLCNNERVIHQKCNIPGPRLIPCPGCQSPKAYSATAN